MSRGLHLVPESQATLRLLVVSRESAVLGPLWSIGKSNSWQLESATNGWGAMERVQSGVTPDLLILDLPRADGDGLHFLRWLRRLRPELPILVLCDRDDSPTQQEAIRLGARDYILRPLKDKALESAILRQLSTNCDNDSVDITSEDIARLGGDSFFVGGSSVMRKLRAQAELLAETDSPIVIYGESGTGKEATARLIHQLSVRSGFKFAKVDCAALPSDLLEAELFGYELNGNGNGHPRLKTGKLELCDKGTILLEELMEMPLTLQNKLLQVLQTKRFARTGSSTAVSVDVRILISSTTSLESGISENKLREDLYYRLTSYTVRVPPLRERREEVPLLLHYFMRTLSKQYALSARAFSPAVLEACQSHPWPGNLREMEEFVKRYLLAGGKELSFLYGGHAKSVEQKSPPPHSQTDREVTLPPAVEVSGSSSLKSLVQTVKLEAEKNAIAAALEQTGWNRKAAARLLKVGYRTLLYKIEQYQMKSPESAMTTGGSGMRPNGNGFGGNGRVY